jgi:hypothetical protein
MRKLPVSSQAEILDFAKYLAAKTKRESITNRRAK